MAISDCVRCVPERAKDRERERQRERESERGKERSVKKLSSPSRVRTRIHYRVGMTDWKKICESKFARFLNYHRAR